jgi:tetratricopeptide (TPR) repeat protein
LGPPAGLLAAALALLLCTAFPARAQAPPEAIDPGSGGRILLVLPFDNRTGQPSLEWIREAAAEILSSRMAAAGFAPMSRTDRIYALDHLGLPQGFHPSRATSLKLAETLDADSIIVGSYVTDGTGIVAQAQLVDVPHLRMSQTVTVRGEISELIPVFDSLAWKLNRLLDPGFKLSEESFIAAGSGMRLDAFEQYIRGITEPDQTERLRHLNSAVQLNPLFSQAWMALGREQYAGQHYEQAAEAFAKVGGNDPGALEAGFYRGLSLLFSGDYAHAADAFAAVAQRLPLAEVLNNQGVALARQGKDGTPLFRQASAADPDQADYHFNLAVSLKRQGKPAEALAELNQCLRMRPADSEAVALQNAWTGQPLSNKPRVAATAAPPASVAPSAASATAKAPAAQPVAEPEEQPEARPDPLERIERNFDAAAFHQAALMLDQMDAARLATLAPRARAQKLSAQAHDYLDRGLLLEAERLYLAAEAADPNSAEAHAGMAELHERAGDAEAARKEAIQSLERMPSVDAYLVLVRQEIAANNLYEAQQNLAAALKIDPQSKPALELKQQIEAKEGAKK